MEGIFIRKIETKDASFLREVALNAYADHYLHLWYDEGKWYMEKYFSDEQLRFELDDNNASFYIAYLNEQPVGFLKLNIDAPLPLTEEENALELERIYLAKEATGHGIGKKLVRLTEQIAKEHHKKLTWLKAMDSSDDAIAFYKKMGFEISGTHLLQHALMKEEFRGMVIMTKPV